MVYFKKKFITKMISEKFSTNPESFNKFGRGHRNSGGMTHVYENMNIKFT